MASLHILAIAKAPPVYSIKNSFLIIIYFFYVYVYFLLFFIVFIIQVLIAFCVPLLINLLLSVSYRFQCFIITN